MLHSGVQYVFSSNIIPITLKTGSTTLFSEAISLVEMASLCETDLYNSSYESQQQPHLSLTEVAAVVVEEAAVRCMAWEVGSNPSEKAVSDMTLVLCPWAINREPE